MRPAHGSCRLQREVGHGLELPPGRPDGELAPIVLGPVSAGESQRRCARNATRNVDAELEDWDMRIHEFLISKFKIANSAKTAHSQSCWDVRCSLPKNWRQYSTRRDTPANAATPRDVV